jgi:hypothetical protein
VPGERKKIGPAAARAYHERRKNGIADVSPYPDNTNCDIERPLPKPASHGVKPSDLLIGAAALLPAMVKIGHDLVKPATEDRGA